MSNLIKVSAQSRTAPFRLAVQESSKTYDLEQVYEQNRYLPERKPPESNLAVIKQVIVEFYAQYGIRLSESSANIVHQVNCTSFAFSTGFDMHSNIGSTANQHARYELQEAFRREVQAGGEQHRVIVWVYN